MNILFINVMEERHGSTYRARRLASLLAAKHTVCYLESNCNDKKEVFPSDINNGNRVISIPQKGSAAGFILASLKRCLFCLREDFDLIFLQKAWPLTLPCLVIAKLRRKKVVIDCDDLDCFGNDCPEVCDDDTDNDGFLDGQELRTGFNPKGEGNI